jgi:hypothetical protein
MNQYLSHYATNGHNPIGSFFKVEETGKVLAVGVLSREQIRKKHNITPNQYRQMENRLNKMKLMDILFSFPEGPYYDILLHRVTHSC